MTPVQSQQFSREWQNLFTSLQQRGYTVEYDRGIIHIRNDENRMNVCLGRSRWVIELEKPFKTPDRTSTTECVVAIGRIEHWLYKAKANKREYSFAIKRIYLPEATYPQMIGQEIAVPS